MSMLFALKKNIRVIPDLQWGRREKKHNCILVSSIKIFICLQNLLLVTFGVQKRHVMAAIEIRTFRH